MKLRVTLIALFVVLMSQCLYASEMPVKLKLNDDFLVESQFAIEIEERIFVPLKPFALAFGGVLEWDSATKVTKATVGENIYLFGQDVNKQRTESGDLPLQTRAFYNENVVYVELRAFCELFGAQLIYEKDTHSVVIFKEDAKLPEEFVGKLPKRLDYTEQDYMTLARLVHIESQGGSLFRSLAVANVVINRVKSPRFANTIQGVIYHPGQFPPTRRASFNAIKPTANSLRAAKLALEGYNNIGECLYFNHRPFSWKDKSDLFKFIEGMYFYL